MGFRHRSPQWVRLVQSGCGLAQIRRSPQQHRDTHAGSQIAPVRIPVQQHRMRRQAPWHGICECIRGTAADLRAAAERSAQIVRSGASRYATSHHRFGRSISSEAGSSDRMAGLVAFGAVAPRTPRTIISPPEKAKTRDRWSRVRVSLDLVSRLTAANGSCF
jgi:hypothetical protein